MDPVAENDALFEKLRERLDTPTRKADSMSVESRQLGYITVSAECLCQCLRLPEGTKILRMRENPTFRNGTADLDVVVEGPHLPAVMEGNAVPPVQVRYHIDDSGARLARYSW